MKAKLLNYLFITLLLLLVQSNKLVAQALEYSPHKLYIKLDNSTSGLLSTYTGNITQTGITNFDQLNQTLNVESIKRVFPYAKKYEYAHQQYGLHQWYEVVFEDTISENIQHYLDLYLQQENVSWSEPVYQMSLDIIQSSNMEVDDPLYEEQWHYHNTGQTGGTAGADIKLPEAWSIQSGDTSVIVAIIDGGIETTHEDLKDALWINQAEYYGTEGVDDDQNGYIDDIHGYGFGDQTGAFYPHYHGTHVAGTVGAINNNGLGVAGIAGGSGTTKGVKLMSCAVFGSNRQGGFPDAFIYAADNGAVIAQNSWGGGTQSEILEDAIDYFIARAGYDNTEENFDKNIQIGPMAGGIVIFSAGNSSTENPDYGYPGSYESCFAVASTDHDDKISYFSNYGNWVEISAPGSEVFSTYTNNSYKHLSGTSMAAPHVSGVAALITSQYGQLNFTPEQVKNILLSSADNIDSINNRFTGKLGAGRLNAVNTLFTDDATIPPSPITDLKIDSVSFASIRFSWTATGGDSLSGSATSYDMRYAENPITAENFDQANKLTINLRPKGTGQPEQVLVQGFPAETTVYIAIKAKDLNGLSSSISNVVDTVTTGAPYMIVDPDSLYAEMASSDTLTQTITIDNSKGKSTLSFQIAEIENSISNMPIQNAQDIQVLVIQERAYWNFYMNSYLKEQFEITADVISYDQISNTEFSDYDLIIIPGGQPSSMINVINNQLDKFEDYVNEGGIALYLTAGNNGLYAPADVYSSSIRAYTNQKISNHYITRGIPDYFSSNRRNYVSGGLLEYLPENCRVLTSTENNDPTTAIYTHGKGEVIISSLYMEQFYINNDDSINHLLFNTTEYALYYANAQNWLHYPEEGLVRAGTSSEISIQFVSKNLSSATYQKKLTISSNDPENAETILPVSLKVNAHPTIVSNKSELTFDSLFIGLDAHDSLLLYNQGVDTLRINAINNSHSAFSTTLATPINLAPFETTTLKVRFTPSEAGIVQDSVIIKSNIEDYKIKLTGYGVSPPLIALDTSTIVIQQAKDIHTTKNLVFANHGSSPLDWNLTINYTKYLPDNNEEQGYTNEENFKEIAYPFTAYTTSLTSVPDQGSIYGLSQSNNAFARYDLGKSQWEVMENPSTYSFRNYRNGVYLNGKIYYLSTSKSNYLIVYDTENDSWSNISSPNSIYYPYNIQEDGENLYILFEDGYLKKYNPIKNEWSNLANISESDAFLGMVHFDKFLYAYTTNEIFKYSIQDNLWETLESPTNQSFSYGACINPLEQFIYIPSNQLWIIYDIQNSKWYVVRNPLTYSSYASSQLTFMNYDEYSGIYFTNGYMFGHYSTSTFVNWLKPKSDDGIIDPSSDTTLSFEIITDDMSAGEYEALAKVRSNNPQKPIVKIPFKLKVVEDSTLAENNRHPVLTKEIGDQQFTLRDEVYSFNLADYFMDPEDYPLTYASSSSNAQLAMTNVQGSVLQIQTLDTGKLDIHLLVQDIKDKTLKHQFTVKIEEEKDEVYNAPPVARFENNFLAIQLFKETPILLDTLFLDEDDDSLTYQYVDLDESASNFTKQDDTLYLNPYKEGTSSIGIIASDPHGNHSEKVTLNILVNSTLRFVNFPENITIKELGTQKIALNSLMISLIEQDIEYESIIDNATVAKVYTENGYLIIEAKQVGSSNVMLKCSNAYGEVIVSSFEVSVEEDEVLGIDDEVETIEKLICYPNPIAESTTVSYQTQKSGRVNLSLYTSEGTLLYTIVDEDQVAGKHEYIWNTATLSSGSYIIQLMSNDEIQHIQALIIH